jgi:hypothetical protein
LTFVDRTAKWGILQLMEELATSARVSITFMITNLFNGNSIFKFKKKPLVSHLVILGHLSSSTLILNVILCNFI